MGFCFPAKNRRRLVSGFLEGRNGTLSVAAGPGAGACFADQSAGGWNLRRKVPLREKLTGGLSSFKKSRHMLLKYSDAGYDSQFGQYVNTAFLSYVIRIARSRALRTMAECRTAGIPYLSSIQYFEMTETSRDNPGADRGHDVLENHWMANLRAKALPMAFEPTKK